MKTSISDYDMVLSSLKRIPPVMPQENVIMGIIEQSKAIFLKEENTIAVDDPVIVVGDIHGQFYDMLEIFNIEEIPPYNKFLFLGDFVDRGYFSAEVMLFLLVLKIKHPSHVYMLRGNHESEYISRLYGFYSECLTKFQTPSIYLAFVELFNFLPISSVIASSVFAVHGGLSPSIHLIEQIKSINRFQELPQEGPFADLLWADPNTRIEVFSRSSRGAGYTFGARAAKTFAHLNGIRHICRSHQLSMKGYETYFDNLVTTVWSAPNYEYRSGNIASIMRVSKNSNQISLKFSFFEAVPNTERAKPNDEDQLSPYFL